MRKLILFAATVCFTSSFADDDSIKIALVYEKTGGWESYATQVLRGVELGFEYATNGTWEVLDKPIELIEKDNQLQPDLSRALLEEAFGDEGAIFAIGPISSSNALAMLPVAEEYERIMMPIATAHSITGDKFIPYVFRSMRNSDHDAISSAVVVNSPDTYVATLTQDYAFGRDGVEAFKRALQGSNVQIVAEEYAPTDTTDFTSFIQRMFDALKDQPGRKVIWVHWGGGRSPIPSLQDMNPERHDIEISTGGNSLAVLEGYKRFPGMEGAIYYYYDLPDNDVNDWLVAKHFDLYDSPPDYFTAGGMDAAIAIVQALKTAGTTDTDNLIEVMENMEFDAPKGRMKFRSEDHQALQPMYHYRVKVDPDVKWAIPELVREISIEEINLPIRNNK